MQISAGIVSVINGSTKVVNASQASWAGVGPGQLFGVLGDGVLYQVAAYTPPSPGVKATITLATPYMGQTDPIASYYVIRDFTTNLKLPLINRGDLGTAEIYNEAIRRLDISGYVQGDMLKSVYDTDNNDVVDGADGPAILGASAPYLTWPNAILVPRYAAHPDSIWAGLGGFDDHFGGTALDPKWQVQTTPGATVIHPVIANSAVNFAALSASSSDDAVYSISIAQTLPNPQPFTITCKLKYAHYNLLTGLAAAPHNALARVFASIDTNATPGACMVVARDAYFVQGAADVAYDEIYCFGGASQTAYAEASAQGVPPYWRFRYDAAHEMIWGFSFDNITWFDTITLSGAQSGFNNAPPTTFRIGCSVINTGRAFAHVDWVRFTNP